MYKKTEQNNQPSPMERASRISVSFLSGTKCTEVLGGLGDNIGTEFERNPPDFLTANFHIEVNCIYG